MDHEITGNMLLGAASVRGTQGTLRAFAPASGQELEPEFGAGGAEDVDRACRRAVEAFDPYRQAALD
ncbi:aldehyde dehydrogenase (NADP(+)), partial [Burkholderia gladioli]|nr:aldehyde dehydrogenase (NADP(+)) [Burkholderia gladioli]